MPNNQGFLTGTGGAASAYTVGASDVGAGVLAQQMHPMYFDSATNTWKTVNTNDRLPVAIAGSVTIGSATPTTGNLLVGRDADGLARAINVDATGKIVISNPSTGGSSGGLTDTQLRATPVPVSVSGVATAANQTTGNTSLASIDTKLGGTLTVSTGGLTDTQLRASAISTTVSNFPATQAVSATALPLPTGAATSTAQTATNTLLTSLDGKVSTKTINSVVAINTTTALTGTGAGSTNVTVASGGTAVQVASNPTTQFATLQNSNASTGTLYYGYSSSVTATTGLELKLGELVNLPVDNTNRLWLYSTAGSIAKIGWV